MPQYTPETADLSAPRIESWVPPRTTTIVSPAWIGRRVTLPLQPTVWLPAYNWSDNTFKIVGNAITYYDAENTANASTYEPMRFIVEGEETTDKTDYRSKEAPQLSEYNITRNIEYYVDGKELITNIDFESLEISADAVVVIYTTTVDHVRVRINMRNQYQFNAQAPPIIDSYTLHLTPKMHLQVANT
jgi:hypothetical protein